MVECNREFNKSLISYDEFTWDGQPNGRNDDEGDFVFNLS